MSGPSTDSRSSLSLQPAASLVGGRTVDVGRRTSQADKQRAMQEPIVKATVEAFGGHIVRVQQFAGGDSPPAIEPVEAEDAPVALNE